MEALNDVDEPLNPYSRLFMVFWAVAMIAVAGFRTGNQEELVNGRKQLETQSEIQAIPTAIKMQLSPSPVQNTLVMASGMSEKSPNSATANHRIR